MARLAGLEPASPQIHHDWRYLFPAVLLPTISTGQPSPTARILQITASSRNGSLRGIVHNRRATDRASGKRRTMSSETARPRLATVASHVRKPVGEHEIRHLGVEADDAVVIKHVVLVVTGPTRLDLECIERGNAMPQGRPDLIVELFVMHFEIVIIRRAVVEGRVAGQEKLAFGADECARKVNDVRHPAGDRLGARKAKLYRL